MSQHLNKQSVSFGQVAHAFDAPARKLGISIASFSDTRLMRRRLTKISNLLSKNFSNLAHKIEREVSLISLRVRKIVK